MTIENQLVEALENDPRATGYAIDQEDIAALDSTSTPATYSSVGDEPERVDPRKSPLATDGWLKVENQGSIGSCQGQSLTENGEYCYAVATGGVLQFSRMFAYLISQMFDGIRSDRGSTLSGGTKAARDVGFCLEKDAPYPSRYPGWGWVTDAMKEQAKKYRLQTHTRIRSADETKKYIASGIGIVQIGIRWGRAMNPDSSGCIRRFYIGGGGHAVVFCGYVPDGDIGQRSSRGYWLLLKNSWSERWGKRGYCYVDPSAVDQMIASSGSVFIGRSDMDTPSPRPVPVDFTKPGGSMYA